ncbi:MAG TPA: hypothetical protein VGR62_17550 [Candidatus Binatia bacterium]|jgi:hypothetical protein|nr:hypothetical protein [Candidatus Binatia bacterium]
MAAAARGTALTVFAVLFALLSVSNMLKPFQIQGAQTGFVLFGERLTGTANAIAGPLFGLFLLVYAIGIWNMRRFALPMAWLYALYVVVNLVLFTIRNETPPGVGYMIFGVVYTAIAIGVSGGSAMLLSRRTAELR